MTDQQVLLCERLKRIGYAKNKQIRMYGQQFELISDPITVGEHLVVVDAIEMKSGSARRVCIPLPIVNMLQKEQLAAA